jgi:hypothetical protein
VDEYKELMHKRLVISTERLRQMLDTRSEEMIGRAFCVVLKDTMGLCGPGALRELEEGVFAASKERWGFCPTCEPGEPSRKANKATGLCDVCEDRAKDVPSDLH